MIGLTGCRAEGGVDRWDRFGQERGGGRLVERGAILIDADQLAREVVAPGTEGLAEVVAAFSDRVLDADGALDRAALGELVFADESARRRLEAIVHGRSGPVPSS